jgi:vanillate O-demethylase ferredoxin subunit
MTSLSPSIATGEPAVLDLVLRLQSRRVEADDIVSFELIDPAGATLPPFEAGSHLLVECEPGVVRSYSLCNSPAERHRYVLAVLREPVSRGGSATVHGQWRVGQTVRVSRPRNHFPLAADRGRVLLLAGGIGITPLLAMGRRLSALGRPWTLYYCARTPERAAFLEELWSLPARVIPVFDGLAGGEPLDLTKVVAEAPAHAHLYCCGPASLIEAFERAAAGRPQQQVHVEWFKPRGPAADAPALAQGEQPFDITLARGGITLHVPAGKSILDVLIEAGVQVQHSCCDGVCGTCETRVIDGVPEHRDAVLVGEAANNSDRMMVCVSRSAGPHLTLDL